MKSIGCATAMLLGLVLWSAPRADACQPTGGNHGRLQWPLDTTGVPLDTPLVVYLFQRDYELLDAQGERVALVEEARLDDHPQGAISYRFARPVEPLTPQTTYTVRFPPLPGQGLPGGESIQTFSFTTGTELGGVRPTPSITIDYLQAEVPCSSQVTTCVLADVEVLVSGLPDGQPVFVSVAGEYVVAHEMYGEPVDTSFSPFIVPRRRDNPCVDVKVIDVAGVILWDEELCTPARCTSSDMTPSVCNGYFRSWPAFDEVAPDSCVPLDGSGLTAAGKAGVPADDTGMPVGPVGATPAPEHASACSLGTRAGGGAGGSAWLWLIGAALLRWRCARRRCARRDGPKNRSQRY